MIQAKRDIKTLTNLLKERRLLGFEKAKANKPWKIISYPYVKNNPVKPDKKKVLILACQLALILNLLYYLEFQHTEIFLL